MKHVALLGMGYLGREGGVWGWKGEGEGLQSNQQETCRQRVVLYYLM